MLRFDDGREPARFPSDARIEIHLRPRQAFGVPGDTGRTGGVGVENRIKSDTNTGRSWIESCALAPLELTYTSRIGQFTLTGNVLEHRARFSSGERLGRRLQTLAFTVPSLLAVTFADPPVVTQIVGDLNGRRFRWAVKQIKMRVATTTEALQRDRVSQGLRWQDVLVSSKRARLAAALQYHHTARRLLQDSFTPGEFLAEALLNFAKVLEAMFPSRGKSQARDSVRSGLKDLGYSAEEIEDYFVPMMLLRNEFDVGHVGLAKFDFGQRETLHEFAFAAETKFCDLLARALDRAETDPAAFVSEPPGTPSADKARLLKRLAATVARDSAA